VTSGFAGRGFAAPRKIHVRRDGWKSSVVLADTAPNLLQNEMMKKAYLGT
jgi:hypothetical protein